jgi:hypothetical protein
MKGYEAGKFPDGAVIIFDLLEAVSGDSAISEGKRKVVGVMLKDSRRFASTGGWGFEGFAGDSKTERAVADEPGKQARAPATDATKKQGR